MVWFKVPCFPFLKHSVAGTECAPFAGPNQTFNASACAVLEVYNSWCGPCKPCKELCKRLYFDNADRGLKFYTIDATVLSKTPQYTGKPHSGSCKPLVIFYKDGAEVEGKRIEGVNYPELLDTVNSLLDA